MHTLSILGRFHPPIFAYRFEALKTQAFAALLHQCKGLTLRAEVFYVCVPSYGLRLQAHLTLI